MKYSKEERLEIDRNEQSQGIEHDSSRAHKAPVDTEELITPGEPMSTSDDYSSMTREELIKKLMKSAIVPIDADTCRDSNYIRELITMAGLLLGKSLKNIWKIIPIQVA